MENTHHDDATGYVTPGSRVRVPAPGGGYHVTWTMGEARTFGGEIKIKCVGVGDVPAGMVNKYMSCPKCESEATRTGADEIAAYALAQEERGSDEHHNKT